MNEQIAKQINRLEEEQQRVKQFLNENGFDCTTAPYVIGKEYRDSIKKHIEVLRMNLEH
jgi:maleate cis-trans isomerase